MTEKKELKIEFAPGAFDQFEGTQEELDELVAEIQNIFTNSTPEELAAMSRPLDIEDLEDLPDDAKEQLARIFLEDENIPTEVKRNLQ
jgi:hypothetical protein